MLLLLVDVCKCTHRRCAQCKSSRCAQTRTPTTCAFAQANLNPTISSTHWYLTPTCSLNALLSVFRATPQHMTFQFLLFKKPKGSGSSFGAVIFNRVLWNKCTGGWLAQLRTGSPRTLHKPTTPSNPEAQSLKHRSQC